MRLLSCYHFSVLVHCLCCRCRIKRKVRKYKQDAKITTPVSMADRETVNILTHSL